MSSSQSELTTLSAVQLADKIRARDVSAREVADAFLARVAVLDEQVRAFITVTGEDARRAADEIDRRLASGENVGPLAGVPVALKDNLCTTGVETTCGSQILRGFRPPYNATVVEKLARAGAVSLGKANLDEFAMGSSTENSGLFTTRNPWDLSKVPGGSSGGSAAAVAARMAPLSLGSDTGGSIRLPAAFCGVVGVKPTYGRVSRYGLVAFASSLDQIGPFAWSVEDAALLLEVVAGQDPQDSTSVPLPVPGYRAALTGEVRGLRIGVPREYFAEGMDDEVQTAVRAALDVLRGLGANVEEVSTPTVEYALPAYYILAPAEASSNLARYDGVRYGHRTKHATNHIDLFEKTRDEGFGQEVKQRIMIGTTRCPTATTKRLPEGAAGPHARQARLRRVLGAGLRRAGHADRAERRVRHRRKIRRPAGDEVDRHLHDHGEHGRHPRPVAAVRLQRNLRPADRSATDGTGLQRGNAATHRLRLRAGDRVAHPPPETVSAVYRARNAHGPPTNQPARDVHVLYRRVRGRSSHARSSADGTTERRPPGSTRPGETVRSRSRPAIRVNYVRTIAQGKERSCGSHLRCAD
jgi:aspartyl-tRNA(Asn)/glutamyl-tRNA(Gln) amidotransferase subunit A